MRALVPFALCLALGACSGASDDADETPPTTPRHADDEGGGGRHADDEPPAPVEEAHPPAARLVRTTGNVLVSSGPTVAGAPLDPGVRITVPTGGSADVDLRDGTRLVIDPGTELVINDVGPAHAILVRGGIHIASPPEDGPRETLRVATSEVSVALSGAGEAYVAADPSGTTWVIALSGLFEISTGETDTRGRLRTLELAAGHTVLAAPRLGEISETGYERLDDARAAVRIAFATLVPVDDERRTRELGASTGRLDESLGALEAEARHGHDLTEAHRAAVAAGDPEEATRVQGDLVTHAQRLYHLREVATARWERVRALALAISARMEPDPIEVRADRVRGLLGE